MEPLTRIRELAAQLPALDSRAALEDALDEVEFLFEVLEPEFQDLAESLMQALRARIAAIPGG